MLPKNKDGCPYLQLAPMEGVGDASFRKAMTFVGGFDEAVKDFLRVPRCAHIKSLATVYHANEMAPFPMAAQIMGSECDLMAEMAVEIQSRGALRIDINCGCPSNTVTGRGAGSSLLKEPKFLNEVATAVVKSVSIPVTLKMRSGYEDISLFEDNLLAAQESGVKYITLHPRTKVDGYGPPARWDLIARAKSILKIPLVGNGDILNVDDALRMLSETHCDGLMIGRGSIINPFIFHQIKAHFSNTTYTLQWDDLMSYLNVYITAMADFPLKTRISKLKQLFSFLFKNSERKRDVLSLSPSSVESFMEFVTPLLKERWA